MSEKTILQGLKSGGSSRHVFENELYRSFFYLIKEGIKKYGLDEEDSASAYSDTIIAIIRQVIAEKFEGRSSLKTYVYQIFSNKCVDLIRKKTTNKRAPEDTVPLDSLVMELPDSARSVIQKIIANDERNRVMEKLNDIGDTCKEMLLLFEDGYSDKEIADLMNYQSSAVVKTTRLRCLGRLKEKLKGSFHS